MLDSHHESEWIPLMDYAMKTGISLSTLRRHIKSKKIPFRIEDGRYLLHDRSFASQPPGRSREDLEEELRRAQMEIAELKTLIAFYEDSASKPVLDV